MSWLTQALWAQSWQLAVLIPLTALCSALLIRRRPHLAVAVWLLVLLKCVTPPILSSPLGVFSWLQSAKPSANAVASVSPQPVSAPQANADFDDPELDVVVRLPLEGSPRLRAEDSQRAAAFPAHNVSALSAPALLAMLWIAGVVFWLCLWRWRWRRFWRTLRESGLSPCPRTWRSEADRLRRRLGLRRPVRLWMTRAPIGPVVAGVVRPAIVLPAALVERNTPRQCAPVLAHELLHIRRGDLWLGWWQCVAQGLWWFHPLVWWAMRAINHGVERCCDREVLAELGCPPAEYARCLLRVLQSKPRPVVALPGVRPVSVHQRRLQEIMEDRNQAPRGGGVAWWGWLLVAMAGMIVLPGAALALKDPAPQQTLPSATYLASPQGPPIQYYPSPSQAAPSAIPAPSPLAPPAQFVPNQAYLPAPVVPAQPPLGRPAAPPAPPTASAPSVAPRPNVSPPPAAPLPAVPWTPSSPRAPYFPPTSLGDSGNSGRLIDVSALFTTLVRRGQVTPDEAATALRDHLVGMCRLDDEQLRTGALRVGFYHLDGARRPFVVASLRPAQMKRLESALKLIEASGFLSIAIEMRLVSIPKSLFESSPALALGWQLSGAPEETAAELEMGDGDWARSLSTASGSQWVMWSAVTEQQLRQVVQTASSDANSNVLMAPKVTVFNGQAATVTSGAQRPFVVGVREMKGVAQPVIRVYSEGQHLRLRPVVEGDGSTLRLACESRTLSIHSVDELKLAKATIQIPRVSEVRVQAAATLQAGQSLALVTMHPNPKNTGELLLLLATPILIEDDVAAVEGDTPNTDPSPAEPASPAKVGEATAASDAVAEFRATNPVLVTQAYHVGDLVVASDEDSEPDYAGLIAKLKEHVAPETWEDGGMGVREFRKTQSLVILQTAEVHDAVADYLESLRDQAEDDAEEADASR